MTIEKRKVYTGEEEEARRELIMVADDVLGRFQLILKVTNINELLISLYC